MDPVGGAGILPLTGPGGWWEEFSVMGISCISDTGGFGALDPERKASPEGELTRAGVRIPWAVTLEKRVPGQWEALRSPVAQLPPPTQEETQA